MAHDCEMRPMPLPVRRSTVRPCIALMTYRVTKVFPVPGGP